MTSAPAADRAPSPVPAPPPPSRGLARELAASLRTVLPLWVTSRLLLLLGGALLLTQPVVHQHLASDSWLSRWSNWDGAWYLAIAEHGYGSEEPGGRFAVGRASYFPGMVVAIRVVHLLTGSWVVAPVVVSAVAGLVAVAALHALARQSGDAESAGRAVRYLVLSPFAVFLMAGYAESLFLAFALTAWLAATRDRWLLAGVLASGAALTRVNGLALVLGLVVLYCHRVWVANEGRPTSTRLRAMLRPPALWLALPVLAVGLWMVRLAVLTGHWDAYPRAAEEGWARETTFPFVGVLQTVRDIGAAFPSYESWTLSIELLALAVFVLVLGLLVRRRDWGCAAYVSGLLLLLSLSSPVSSAARATVLLFPAFILLGRVGARRRSADLVVLYLFTPAMVLHVAIFVVGGWVA